MEMAELEHKFTELLHSASVDAENVSCKVHESISFRQFLRECRDKLALIDDPNWVFHVCIGNEAADLDSMVSANTLAYYYTLYAKTPNVVYLPVIDIPRDEYRLRTAATYLFSRMGITPEDWLFAEDVPLHRLHNERRLKLSLTDHNRLHAKYDAFDDDVVEIVDHHADEAQYEDTVGENRHLLRVGSCCTLVAQRWLATQEGLAHHLDVAWMLLAPIVLDTLGLDPAKNKVTSLDEQAARDIAQTLPAVEVDHFYRALALAKQDISGLTQADLLRGDYKEITQPMQAGFSSIVCPLATMIALDAGGFKAAIDAFMVAKRVSLLVLLSGTVDEHGNKTRELGMAAHDEALLARVTALVDQDNTLRIEPNPCTAQLPAAGPVHIALYYQRNRDASRKVVLPLLKKFLGPGHP